MLIVGHVTKKNAWLASPRAGYSYDSCLYYGPVRRCLGYTISGLLLVTLHCAAQLLYNYIQLCLFFLFGFRAPALLVEGMLFKGFDVPLQMLTGEKFEQPILFGANNLSGVVQTNIAYAGGWWREPFRSVPLSIGSP